MNRARGFTLIEVLIAVAVTAMAMVAISGAFLGTLRARNEITTLGDSTSAGQRILTLLERDLRGLWHHNIKGNRVLVGTDSDRGGYDADRIDMLTTTDSVLGTLDTTDQIAYPSICEVGYRLKENEDIPGLLELWRREDPLVDQDIQTQGQFLLVCDRIHDFNITYYDSIGYQAEEFYEWDSSKTNTLPRRIKIEFTVHRQVANRNRVSGNEVEDFEKIKKTYVRHIVFDRRYVDILKPGIAMVSVAPSRPQEEGGPIGGGGGPAGPGAGPAGDGGGNVSRGPATTQVRGEGPIRGADPTRGGPGGDRTIEIGPGNGRRGGQRPPGLPPGLPGGAPPPNVPIDLGELLRGGGLQGGGSGLFGGLGR